MAIEHRDGCMAKSVASAYVFVFSLLHIMAPLTGCWIRELGFPLSTATLILGGGFLTLSAVFVDSKILRVALSIGYAFAWTAEWTKLVTWVPPWSNLQYVVVASMNFANAVSLALLGEVWKIG